MNRVEYAGTPTSLKESFGFVSYLAEEILAVEHMKVMNEKALERSGQWKAMAISIFGMCALQFAGLFFFCHYFQLFV